VISSAGHSGLILLTKISNSFRKFRQDLARIAQDLKKTRRISFVRCNVEDFELGEGGLFWTIRLDDVVFRHEGKSYDLDGISTRLGFKNDRVRFMYCDPTFPKDSPLKSPEKLVREIRRLVKKAVRQDP